MLTMIIFFFKVPLEFYWFSAKRIPNIEETGI